ncbi:MAG TPA: hypothetical protein VKV32_00745 [Stellaceae bacterium]|nr:hypothetical protein [Stellaceae bacterium]
MLRTFKRAVMVGMLVAGAAGCAAPQYGPPRVVVQGDKFSDDVTILGVQVLVNPLMDFEKEHWYLRSFVNPKAQRVRHQLYAELIYTDGRNGAYFAADNHARPYRVDLIYSEGCGRHAANDVCIRQDTVGIDIPEATLRAEAAQGFEMKISARSGYAVILSVTPEMINAQLYATQQILSGAVVVGQTVQSGGTIQAAP